MNMSTIPDPAVVELNDCMALLPLGIALSEDEAKLLDTELNEFATAATGYTVDLYDGSKPLYRSQKITQGIVVIAYTINGASLESVKDEVRHILACIHEDHHVELKPFEAN